MSKIAIISQPDQGVLIDVSGCTTMQEAIEHLSSTLQVSSQFWKGSNVALNLGKLDLAPAQVSQILAITKGVGAIPYEVFSTSGVTKASLEQQNVRLGSGTPMSLPIVNMDASAQHDMVEDDANEYVTAKVAEEDITYLYETQESQELTETLEEEPAATNAPPVPQVLYLRQTLRSGQTVSHKGHLVIVGDVNPGAELMAEGDITVWGSLRGIAHAGIGGNVNAEIRALKLQPVQIRIAHAIARSPDRPNIKFASQKGAGPETARLVDGKIRVSKRNIE
ncbi:MAG TPA: septum site-determining protein MinC [Planktothrix sp.]|jgi:septum site-determining protein MinC